MTQIPTVTDVRYVREYILWLRFADGTEGDVDLSKELYGIVFEPLRDKRFFATVRVDPDLGTITWPNGADFAPEFLYSLVRVAAGR